MNTDLIKTIEESLIKIRNSEESTFLYLYKDKIEQNILCELIKLSKNNFYDNDEKLNILSISLKKLILLQDYGFHFLCLTLENLIETLKTNEESYYNIVKELENCYFK